jgi:DNA-binding NarL/FixJ family response regulator
LEVGAVKSVPAAIKSWRSSKVIHHKADLDRILVRRRQLADIVTGWHVRRSQMESSQDEAPWLTSPPAIDSELNPPIRVFLLDSCHTFRDGLELAIARSKTLQVIGRAGSAKEMLENNRVPLADITLIDLDNPGSRGLDLCQRLLQAAPSMRVLLIGYTDWDVYLLAAQTAHACGLLLRSQPTSELITALEKSISGPIFSLEQIRRIQTWRGTIGAKLKTLRRREWQVLELVARGMSNREIAQQLSVSENTIEKHVSNLLQKLGLVSRAMMIVFIYTHHLDALGQMAQDDRFLAFLTN